MSESGLQTLTIEFQVGNSRVVIKPKQAGNNVFFTVEVNTPLGLVSCLISMEKKTFLDLHTLVHQHGILPRLSDVIEGTFGWRPFRVDRRAYNGDGV